MSVYVLLSVLAIAGPVWGFAFGNAHGRREQQAINETQSQRRRAHQWQSKPI